MPTIVIKSGTTAIAGATVYGSFSYFSGDTTHDLGPTSSTGFYSGIDAPVGGYTVYGLGGSNSITMRVATSGAELNSILIQDGATGSTLSQNLTWGSSTGLVFINSGSTTVITSGLTLNLDAGDPASYPGTGTTWTDLSGSGNTGTLVGGPTFTSANGGSIILNGSTNYVSCGTGLTSSSVFTYSFWIYPTTSATPRTLVGNGSNVAGPQMRLGNTNKIELNAQNTALIGTSTGTVPTSGWTFATVTYTGTDYAFYINGSQSGTGSNTKNLVVTAVTWIGARSFGPSLLELFTGNIAMALKYNRVLSSAEVLQNYNSTKARFGL